MGNTRQNLVRKETTRKRKGGGTEKTHVWAKSDTADSSAPTVAPQQTTPTTLPTRGDYPNMTGTAPVNQFLRAVVKKHADLERVNIEYRKVRHETQAYDPKLVKGTPVNLAKGMDGAILEKAERLTDPRRKTSMPVDAIVEQTQNFPYREASQQMQTLTATIAEAKTRVMEWRAALKNGKPVPGILHKKDLPQADQIFLETAHDLAKTSNVESVTVNSVTFGEEYETSMMNERFFDQPVTVDMNVVTKDIHGTRRTLHYTQETTVVKSPFLVWATKQTTVTFPHHIA